MSNNSPNERWFDEQGRTVEAPENPRKQRGGDKDGEIQRRRDDSIDRRRNDVSSSCDDCCSGGDGDIDFAF